ncbi:MAG: hypothetical protein WCZ23_17195 [Rhodospirillaceae bacterium]
MKPRLRTAALVVGLLIAPGVAVATYPVIDTSALAEAGKQLSALKEQIALIKKEIEATTEILSVVNDVSKFAQEQLDAIGELGRIDIPMLNLAKIATQLHRDASCLMPDFSKMMPNANFSDINLKSVCSARSAYSTTLWFDPAQAEGMTWDEQQEARQEVLSRRQNVLRSAAVDGLSHADVQTAAAADQADRAVVELERAAQSATNMNARLAVSNQALILIARQQATQTQLLASLLKLQGATAMMSSVDQAPMDAETDETEETP